jgi:hypothetical protein
MAGGVDGKEGAEGTEGKRRKKPNVQGAIHSEPDDKRKRIVLITNLSFEPKKKK